MGAQCPNQKKMEFQITANVKYKVPTFSNLTGTPQTRKPWVEIIYSFVNIIIDILG